MWLECFSLHWIGEKSTVARKRIQLLFVSCIRSQQHSSCWLQNRYILSEISIHCATVRIRKNIYIHIPVCCTFAKQNRKLLSHYHLLSLSLCVSAFCEMRKWIRITAFCSQRVDASSIATSHPIFHTSTRCYDKDDWHKNMIQCASHLPFENFVFFFISQRCIYFSVSFVYTKLANVETETICWLVCFVWKFRMWIYILIGELCSGNYYSDWK